MDGLETTIKKLIEELYCCKFTGDLTVTKNDDLYKLTLYLHDLNFPSTFLMKQCNSEDEFIEFVKKELWDRRLDRSEFAQLRIYGNHETCEGLGRVPCGNG